MQKTLIFVLVSSFSWIAQGAPSSLTEAMAQETYDFVRPLKSVKQVFQAIEGRLSREQVDSIKAALGPYENLPLPEIKFQPPNEFILKAENQTAILKVLDFQAGTFELNGIAISNPGLIPNKVAWEKMNQILQKKSARFSLFAEANAVPLPLIVLGGAVIWTGAFYAITQTWDWAYDAYYKTSRNPGCESLKRYNLLCDGKQGLSGVARRDAALKTQSAPITPEFLASLDKEFQKVRSWMAVTENQPEVRRGCSGDLAHAKKCIAQGELAISVLTARHQAMSGMNLAAPGKSARQ